MALLRNTARSSSPAEFRDGDCLTIGLVNNMPDSAWEATERQFLDLIRAATPDVVVRLKLFSIADVPRGDYVRAKLADRYHDISALGDTCLDGLVVTGTEPRAANLKDEPYWPALTTLIAWARENTVSTIWSCLAAHAAVLHVDGIERQPLEAKQFGVFDCEMAAEHRLMAGAPPRLRVPHSRYNDLSETALAACGYRLLTKSAAAGVDAFSKEEPGSSLFLFFQGHPEYDANTLLREYRRDIGRFLRSDRAHYPAAPEHYFNGEAMMLADAFRRRALNERRESLLAEFPMGPLEARVENTWRHSAIGVYANWIDYLRERKAERRGSIVPVQRRRRAALRVAKIPAAADRSQTADSPARRAKLSGVVST
jgi:homoserine O-succinyltransferase/O-acetyltransferase